MEPENNWYAAKMWWKDHISTKSVCTNSQALLNVSLNYAVLLGWRYWWSVFSAVAGIRGQWSESTTLKGCEHWQSVICSSINSVACVFHCRVEAGLIIQWLQGVSVASLLVKFGQDFPPASGITVGNELIGVISWVYYDHVTKLPYVVISLWTLATPLLKVLACLLASQTWQN